MTRVFLERGLVPATVIAARPRAYATPAAPSTVRIRPLQPGDVNAATDLWLQLVRWDAKFSSTTERPSTPAAIRQVLVTHAHRQPRWAWVVEHLGELVGLLVASPADHAAAWVAPLTCLSPAAYLDCIVVAEQHRSSGVGAALAQQAHAALDAAGMAVTLLHYTALSPVSGPFWHRCGYRPLWTSWHAHPASALRLP